MLKEMLKIDGAGTGSASTQEEAGSSEQQKRRRSSKKLGAQVIIMALHSFFYFLQAQKPKNSPVPLSNPFLFPTRPLSVPAAANMNVPHGDATGSYPNHSGAAPSSKVSDLARACASLGMAPPEFSFIGKRQVTACTACTAPAPTRLQSPSSLARSHLLFTT